MKEDIELLTIKRIRNLLTALTPDARTNVLTYVLGRDQQDRNNLPKTAVPPSYQAISAMGGGASLYSGTAHMQPGAVQRHQPQATTRAQAAPDRLSLDTGPQSN